MAAIVDLGQQLRIENVKHLPPQAPAVNGRPSSGGFQNRGRLFSAHTQQIHISQRQPAPPVCDLTSPTPPTQELSVTTPVNHRRVQSAKARLELAFSNCVTADDCQSDNSKALSVTTSGTDLAIFDVNRNLSLERKCARRRPRSAARGCDENIHSISSMRSICRPSSDKSSVGTSAPLSPAEEKDEQEEPTEDLKPSVYGYRLKRQVYGSNPDIFTPGLQEEQPTPSFKFDLSHDQSQNQDFLQSNSHSTKFARRIPSHLEPLRPWLTQTVPSEVIGADPASSCLVFLPLNQNYDDLPVVPLS